MVTPSMTVWLRPIPPLTILPGALATLAAVGGCAQIGDRLELRDPAGRVLAAIDGVDPRAGAWVAAAIEASLPARG